MNRTTRLGRILLPIISLILIITLVAPAVFADTAQVKGTTVNVRSGPGLDNEVIDKITKGSTYTILSKKDSWLEIDLGNQKKGWVADWLVDIQGDQTEGKKETYLESKVDVLNVRSGPSTSFAIIEKLSLGKSYLVLESEGEWSKIKLSEEKSGWVSTQYTKNVESTEKEQPAPPTNVSPSTESNTKPNTNEEPQKSVTKVMVNTDILNLRKSASLNAEIVQKLSRGTQATILQTVGEWSEVELGDGTKGWLSRTYIKEVNTSDHSGGQPPLANNPTPNPTPSPAPQEAKVKILTEGTNIRKGPSTKEAIVLKAKEGQVFPIVKTEGEWFKINIGNGKTAYVAGWVVAAEGVPNVERNSLSNVLKGKVIVVDAGHGGNDRGAEGPGKKTKEKEVNLIVATLLAKKLEAAGAKVIMTRSDDTYLSLQQRVDISMKHNSDAFISIHHNTYKHSSMNGSMTFYYSEKTDKNLARYIQSDLVKHNGLKDLNVRHGDYYVLRENPLPTVLVELGFLTNLNEELMIRSSRFQENSAEGIFQGTLKYFANLK